MYVTTMKFEILNYIYTQVQNQLRAWYIAIALCVCITITIEQCRTDRTRPILKQIKLNLFCA